MPPPSFDQWTTLFLLASAQGFFVAGALFFRHRGRVFANRLLASLVFLFAVTLGEYVLFWTRWIGRFPHAMNVSAVFPLVFGPVLIVYLRELFGEKRWQGRADWLFFVLPAAAFLVWLGPFYFFSDDEKREVLLGKRLEMGPKWLLAAMPWLKILHMAAASFLIEKLIRRNAASSDELRWARALGIFFVGVWAMHAAYFAFVRLPFFSPAWDYGISAAMSVFVYGIAWFGLAQPAVFEGERLAQAVRAVAEPPFFEKYRSSTLTEAAADSILKRLEKAMADERLFLDSDLRLEALAEKIGATRHQLSQVLNEKKGLRFSEFLNHWRLEEAKKLLRETDLSARDVAFQAGFGNKASFFSAFKKATGQTPNDWRAEKKS